MPRKGDIKSLVGQRFGRLDVIKLDRVDARRRSFWLCLCACGQRVSIDGHNLKSGNSKSCGCLRKEIVSALSTFHGHNRPGCRSPEYQSWTSMWSRVRAKSGLRWRDYGARGITACDRWRSFEAFLSDMGARPPFTSLDRINNNGNYEPGNCRWATVSQQNSNQRRSRKYTRPKEEAQCRHQSQ